ncbi:Pheromone-binding protein-related protein 6 [Pseudolycoriella hygida]|uniref:Pheromone-binding protein-related protein 6 n=1 Tax=Pseudolycoriella hygida TaxID=35572 RepID=A0A9Q0N156_9DIPT|nr:Pheromone-binding protein-related protein 6 [Pseudolycoriella hygida]
MTSIAFVSFVVLLGVGQLNAELRRDDKWPPPEFLEFIKPIRKSCQEKTGVSDAAIAEFSDGQVHEDAALKCYMNCLFHEFKVVDDKGEVHFEKIETHVAKLDEEVRHIASNLIAKCQNPTGADQCERAFSIHKCWKTNDPKVTLEFFFI